MSLSVVMVIGGNCVLSNCCGMNTYMRRVCAPENGPLTSRVQRPGDAGLRAAGSSIL
jgi:hypothetical protein